MKVIHVECRAEKVFDKLKEETLSYLKDYDKIVLVSTAQHLHEIKSIIKFLENNGKKCIIKNNGQVLGCRVSNALSSEAECVVYYGSGRFHPLEIGVKTKKPVLIIDPSSRNIKWLDENEVRSLENKRFASAGKACLCNVFGILISTKSGQYNYNKALGLKKYLKDKGREVYLFLFDELRKDYLDNFPDIEAWINTACPRIIDDYYDYGRPVINDAEVRFIN